MHLKIPSSLTPRALSAASDFWVHSETFRRFDASMAVGYTFGVKMRPFCKSGLLAACAVLTVGCSRPPTQRRVEHVARTGRAEPPISPTRIVYSQVVDPREDDGNGWTGHDLFLSTIPGERTRRLTKHAESGRFGGAIARPEYSPDGSMVLFLANHKGTRVREWTEGESGNRPVWLLNVPARSAYALTPPGWKIWRYEWLPKGRSLVAEVSPSKHQRLLVWIDVQSKKVRRLPSITSGVWTIDNSTGEIVYFKQSGRAVGLFRLSLASGDAKKIAVVPGCMDIAVSPDGRKVAYRADDQVVILSRNGATLDRRRLTLDRKMLWSPDSRYLALQGASFDGAYRATGVDRWLLALDTRSKDLVEIASWTDDPGESSRVLLGWLWRPQSIVILQSLEPSPAAIEGIPDVRSRLLALWNGEQRALLESDEPWSGVDWYQDK